MDYMGASEFEWGAIPKALREVADHSDAFRASTIKIPRSDIGATWRGKAATKDGAVYLLARPEHAAHAESVIRACARDEHNLRLKEGTRLVDALNPAADERRSDICGWLELDNGFWFFTDRDMCTGVAALYGMVAL